MKKEKQNILLTVPVRRSDIVTQEVGEEEVMLVYPRSSKRWILRLLPKLGVTTHFHVPLEKYGTAVWQLIDSHRNVESIIAALTRRFPDEEELPNRALLFIVQLHKDGFIKLMGH